MWVAGDGIVFSVELARPFVVRRITVLVCAIHGDLNVVSGNLIDNRVILRHPSGELRFGFVELPSAHLWVCETDCRAEKAQRQGQSSRFCFHRPSEPPLPFFVNISFSDSTSHSTRARGNTNAPRAE